MAWGASTKDKKYKQRDGWGAQTKKKAPKGTQDERDVDKGEVWEGTKRVGYRGSKS